MQPSNRHDAPSRGEREIIEAARREAKDVTQSPLYAALPPTAIPGYTIVREIGRGGMGVIYEAQQNNPARAVALKVMRGGGGVGKHRLTLFRQEVETLARLNCPNIAAIYGAGSTEDGRHYFAMELVRGVPLTDYVRQKQPPLREQLQLFRKICDAVHYAHQRGVIHRDLKPSNILVDAEGNPKVLDFGLARIEDVDEPTGTLFKDAGRVMGTLPYMSPEQADGRPDEIDIRTDIYALGVILYETLTNRLPYDLAEATHEHARRLIREQTPLRPGALRRALRGDLEIIVLKALEKDPAKRYQSAAALGDDLERYLTSQPILARPLSAAYQLRKLVARHKALPTYVATLFVLVAGFGIWMTILYGNAEAARSELAEQRRLVKVALSRARMAEARVKEEADAAREASEEQRRVAAVSLARAQEAENRAADALDRLAESLMQRRDFGGAEGVLRESLELRRSAGAKDWQRAYTASLLGECLSFLDRHDEAEALLLESYPIVAAALGEHDEHTLNVLQRIVILYATWDKLDQAAEWGRKLDAARAAAGGD